MSNHLQQKAVNIAIGQERSAGRDVGPHPQRTPGKEFAEGFSEYLLVFKTGTVERQLFLDIYPNFETRLKQPELTREYVKRIRTKIRDFGDARDEEVKRIVVIS